MALFTFSGMCHSRYLRENLRCAYCHTQPYMALSRTEHALYNYSIRCNLLINFLLYLKVFWGNLIKNKSLNLNDIVDYLSQCQRGLGCGDKHSVVDSDRNSTKHNNVNTGCRNITFIIRRYFRAAGTWRGIFEPSTVASDE